MAFTHPRKNLLQFGISSGDVVADLGAGAGHYALEAARIVGKEGQVYAIEIQRELVSKVKAEADEENLANVEVIWGDLENEEGSTLADRSVDAVILSNVLFQISDMKTLLTEAFRILQTDGRLLVVDWSDSHGGVGPRPQHIVTEQEVRELCVSAGFKPVELIEPGAHHFGIILQKANKS